MKKIMQHAARVRFADYLEHEMEINLRIYSSGKRWDMDIKARGEARKRIPIAITSDYLKQLNTRLKSPMGKVMHHAAIGGALAEEELNKADLAALAKAGHSVFMEIFGQREAWKTMQKHFAAAHQITIEVDSEDFFIPWELLYSDSLSEPLAFEKFWGMKHIIHHLIIQDDRPGDAETKTIHYDSRPRLGLFAFEDASLPSIKNKEIPFFNKLKKDGKITLQKLPYLDPTVSKKEAELVRFKKFLNKPLHVAHFACHALYDEKDQVNSFIQLSNGIRISLDDLAQEPKTVIRDFPLVVLNACKTGQVNPMDVRYFAGDFIKYGALGVVATEAAVPDGLAADFTCHLYRHLLKGTYLGESVLRTRQELMRRGNPAGLLYALYATPIIKLQLGAGN